MSLIWPVIKPCHHQHLCSLIKGIIIITIIKIKINHNNHNNNAFQLMMSLVRAGQVLSLQSCLFCASLKGLPILLTAQALPCTSSLRALASTSTPMAFMAAASLATMLCSLSTSPILSVSCCSSRPSALLLLLGMALWGLPFKPEQPKRFD